MYARTTTIASILASCVAALVLSACAAERRADEPPAQASPPLLQIASPVPGARVASTLTIEGRAPGYWFFEAVMPVELSTDGRKIIDSYVEAHGDWMTADLVPFRKTFALPPIDRPTPATLVFRRNNASGLPEHDAEHRVAITLVPRDSDSSGGRPGDGKGKPERRSRLAAAHLGDRA